MALSWVMERGKLTANNYNNQWWQISVNACLRQIWSLSFICLMNKLKEWTSMWSHEAVQKLEILGHTTGQQLRHISSLLQHVRHSILFCCILLLLTQLAKDNVRSWIKQCVSEHELPVAITWLPHYFLIFRDTLYLFVRWLY